MKNKKGQVSNFTKKLKLIHGALLIAPIATGTIFYLLSENLRQDLYFGTEFPLIIALILSSISVFLGNLLFKKHIFDIDKGSYLEEKLNTFRTALDKPSSIVKRFLDQSADAPNLFNC